jgi:hypothetical protein
MIAVGKQTRVCAAHGMVRERFSTLKGSRLIVGCATPPGSDSFLRVTGGGARARARLPPAIIFDPFGVIL